MINDNNITVLFNGFLQLPNLEKLKMVNAINEYFDSNDREVIRKENDEKFSEITFSNEGTKCVACGR
ncbi:MAG: hypothetical protein KF685_01215 [Acidobacteria bacterium]|nr:hypothetical protein [Acidobacteriota bacterium]